MPSIAKPRTLKATPGDYTRYYAGLRDAVLHGAASPVTADDALRVMELIDLGLLSAHQGRRVAVPWGSKV